jgi:hypothetical protein
MRSRPKYKNRKTLFGGIGFDSRKEASYYQQLKNRDQQREYRTVSYLVSTLANICEASPNKIIDLLTGYLWDEEEAGEIKVANINAGDE